ncbi:MAG: DUF4440 domain-containing protein [Chitinophagaceae bacterium]
MLSRTKWLFTLILGFFFLPSFAQTRDEQAIRRMLAAQIVQWNHGNPAGYMKGYWQNDSLVFIGKSGPTYGFDSTLAHYRNAYPSVEKMGKLQSGIIRVRMLSSKYAYVIGRWQLVRKAGNLAGYYTLLLEKMKGAWVIIEDHSS